MTTAGQHRSALLHHQVVVGTIDDAYELEPAPVTPLMSSDSQRPLAPRSTNALPYLTDEPMPMPPSTSITTPLM